MGFTALGGLVMGRRCGDLDPGVVLHLMRARNMSADDVENLLSRQSGLFGVSGMSDDMRTLLQSDDPRAKEAVDLFTYRAAREIGSLAAAIDGLDVLVFTGGIGENSATIRKRRMSACSWLGVKADDGKNQNNDSRISAEGGAADVFVIPTDEEAVIAQSLFELLSPPPGGASPASKGRRL
jgi:acetate kinase